MTDDNKTVRLVVCGFNRNPRHCVYLNDHRIAGGKPWGGATDQAEWRVSVKELRSALPELFTPNTKSPRGGETHENAIGCAEKAVGQYFYRRVEALMDAEPGTPEGEELLYLATAIADVEEYGALGTEDIPAEPFKRLSAAPSSPACPKEDL